MKRKIVKQGAATFMISLPSKWCKQFGLKKGDEIDVEIMNNNLLVSPNEIRFKAETEITLTGMTESSIRVLITNTYRLGYDKIRVNFGSEAQFKILHDVIKTKLLGFDIIKKEKNFCIIENITEPSSEQFENLLQKIFYNGIELFEITKQRLQGIKPSENYEDVDTRIKQYDNFCRRVMVKKPFEKNTPLFWTFLTLMIHGLRELYHLNQFLDKNKIKASKELIELLEEGKRMFSMIQEAYSKKDVTILERVHDLEKSLIYKKAYKIMNNVPAYHITSCIRSLYLASSPLMGLLL
jgi:phosphate uptake regulator